MHYKDNPSDKADKTLAAVCGLYCGACTLYIATQEDPERLKKIAERFQVTEDVVKCYGCRSRKRGPYCRMCKMTACASERGIDFCVECTDYPCEELKQFQSERPHRIELWSDLERIRAVGYIRWLKETRANYTCTKCQTINSAYDLKCRKCGKSPSCDFVAKHEEWIKPFLKHL